MFILNRRTLLKITGANAASALLPKAALAASSTDVFTADEAGALVR